MALRYAGTLRQLGVGRAHSRTRGIALVNGPNVMAISRPAGEGIAEFTIDPAKDFQAKRRRSPPTDRNDVVRRTPRIANDVATHTRAKNKEVSRHRVNDVLRLHKRRADRI